MGSRPPPTHHTQPRHMSATAVQSDAISLTNAVVTNSICCRHATVSGPYYALCWLCSSWRAYIVGGGGCALPVTYMYRMCRAGLRYRKHKRCAGRLCYRTNVRCFDCAGQCVRKVFVTWAVPGTPAPVEAFCRTRVMNRLLRFIC